jgi:hypothetical protein
MALLWIDGFDHYNSSQIQRMYEESGNVEIGTTARTGGQALRPYSPTTTKYLGVNASTLIVGAAVYVNLDAFQPWSPNHFLFRFFDGTTQQCQILLGPEGQVRLYRDTTVVDESPKYVYSLRQWFYIEVKCTFSASTGSWELRVNSRTVRTASGLNTIQSANAYANRLALGAGYENMQWIDDLYVCDSSGSTNNDFLGDIKVVTILPNADGSNTGWTPSSGTSHYAVVDESPANDDTDYLYTSTAGATDTENFQDITLTGSIKGILQLACIRKDDAGARSAALICRVGTTDYEGPEVSLGNSYTYLQQIRETNPATGSPWTVADINAAQFGVRMKS